jgi:DNA topoisomerase VI subunit B
MKTAVIASPIIASNNMDASVMGMDAQGMDLATFFMRDKIYSNKIRAVVREYACNAIDEHKKFGIERPVDIGLRYEGQETVFFCRDYAKGLDENGVRNIFGMYFRSTKSTSNDAIGGFGVGSKAGHCYNDTFFVVSHFRGSPHHLCLYAWWRRIWCPCWTYLQG